MFNVWEYIGMFYLTAVAALLIALFFNKE